MMNESLKHVCVRNGYVEVYSLSSVLKTPNIKTTMTFKKWRHLTDDRQATL